MNGTLTNDQLLLQAFLQVVIAVAVPLLVAFFAMILRVGLTRLRLALNQEQLAFAHALITQLVKAAEQYNLAGILKQTGEQKKAWVIERATQELSARGIYLNVQVLADQIESAVLENIPKASDPAPNTRELEPSYVTHPE